MLLGKKWSLPAVVDVEDAHFGVVHLGHLVHGTVVVDGLDGFVDDAVTDGKDALVGIGGADVVEEAAGPFTEGADGLDVGWPDGILHVGDITAGEVAPVAFAKQRGGVDRQTVGLGDDGGGMYGALQVAGDEGIDRHGGHPVAQLLGLADAILVELSLHLSLQYLTNVINGFAVAY